MKPTREELDLLVEAASTAWRPRDPDGAPRPHPAWADLPPADRLRAFDAATSLRALEAATDPNGLSTTARSILSRIRR